MTSIPPFRTFLTPAQRRGDTNFGTAVANLVRQSRNEMQNIMRAPMEPLNPPSRRGQALVASRRQTRKRKTKKRNVARCTQICPKDDWSFVFDRLYRKSRKRRSDRSKRKAKKRQRKA